MFSKVVKHFEDLYLCEWFQGFATCWSMVCHTFGRLTKTLDGMNVVMK